MQPDFLRNTIVNSDMKSIYDAIHIPECLRNSSFYITGASGMLASYLTFFLIWLNEHHLKDLTLFIYPIETNAVYPNYIGFFIC